MQRNNRSLFIIALIAVVNALGYGIIIPVLYSYSQKFGLSDFQNGLLFSAFSLAQFISTPIIGRLSDKYGRKPLLTISVAGTALSFLMMAFAPSAIWLFLARILDGLTAGNIPVASAVISDTTKPQDRAKGFGIIGASFGFGFVFGPAIAALTLRWGDAMPFIVAAVVSIVAMLATWIFLPETNQHMGEVQSGKLFDFKHLFTAVLDKNVGTTLLISLLYSMAFSLFIYGFQPFSVKVLHLSAQRISLIFTLIGVVGFVAQAAIIPQVVKRLGDQKTLVAALSLMIVTFTSFFLVRSGTIFIIIAMINALANSFVGPLTQSLLSKEMDAQSQGSILGINSSYVAIGMIVGPIIGGVLATISVPFPFLGAAIVIGISTLLALQLMRKHFAKQHAF